MTDAPATIKSTSRVVLIDVARGVALFAMAIYHFTWDLEFFGYAEPGLTAQGGWKLFARMIAGSFLFLVGISLVLAHADTIRWRSFAIRLVMIVAGAALITVLTYFATPDRYIFFGILHCIAVSSILGLPFLKLPAVVSLVAGFAVLFAQPFLAAPLFNNSALLWLGLSTTTVQSNDYVPLFPWFGSVLLGIGAAKIAEASGFFSWLAAIYRGENSFGKPFAFAGRHSLAVYLVHQPVLISLVYLASLVIPATATISPASVNRNCNITCTESNNADFCMRYCQCVVDELVAGDLLKDLSAAQSSGTPGPEIQTIVDACAASAIEQGGAE